MWLIENPHVDAILSRDIVKQLGREFVMSLASMRRFATLDETSPLWVEFVQVGASRAT
jgi:hypothetical protein